MKQIIRYFFLLMLCQLTSIGFAQTSNFTSDGDWDIALNWDNGVPISTTNVFVQGVNCTVSSNAECNNLTLEFGSSLTINSDDTLTINGNFDQEDFVTLNNDGLIIIFGELQSNGDPKITVGGSIEFAGKLELNSGGQQGPQ